MIVVKICKTIRARFVETSVHFILTRRKFIRVRRESDPFGFLYQVTWIVGSIIFP